MITITKEAIDSFDDVCEKGVVEANNIWKGKEDSFPIAIKDLPISLEHKLYLLFKLGVHGFDVLLFLSPYDTVEQFDAAQELPENRNLYTSPFYFVIYRMINKTYSLGLAISIFEKHLTEEQINDFLTNGKLPRQ